MDELRKTSFTDRITQAAKAREAQLARARAKSPANDPDFAKRQAERADLKVSRDAREAQRRAEKLIEAENLLAKKLAAATTERETALAAVEAHKESLRKVDERTAALATQQKAARDARYAGRKLRQNKR
jgi:hypothetical protein